MDRLGPRPTRRHRRRGRRAQIGVARLGPGEGAARLRVALDTSVLVRLLTGRPTAEAARARSRIEEAHRSGDDVLVTDAVAAETFHALRHHYGVPREEAAEAIRRVVSSGVVRLEPAEALRAWRKGRSATRLVDRLVHERHAALGAVTWTFDRRQARLDGATRI